jgi:hypothetical protein
MSFKCSFIMIKIIINTISVGQYYISKYEKYMYNITSLLILLVYVNMGLIVILHQNSNTHIFNELYMNY